MEGCKIVRTESANGINCFKCQELICPIDIKIKPYHESIDYNEIENILLLEIRVVHVL